MDTLSDSLGLSFGDAVAAATLCCRVTPTGDFCPGTVELSMLFYQRNLFFTKHLAFEG